MYSLSAHEKKQHGTLEFPVAYYYVDASNPQYQMSFHWHKEWEIIRILKGEFTVHAEEQAIIAKEGDFILLREGILHGGIPNDCIYECFVFDLHTLFRSMELVKKQLRPLYRLQLLPNLLYPKEQYPLMHTLVEELIASFTKPERTHLQELTTVSCLGQLFACILQYGLFQKDQADSGSAHHIGQIKPVIEYIEQHYQNTISLENLALVANMNPKYFCRIFREITRQTPMDYVISYRIEQAAKLLSTTRLSVLEVGMDCGFNDSSYFIRVFKQLKQMTPGQYRRMMIETGVN